VNVLKYPVLGKDMNNAQTFLNYCNAIMRLALPLFEKELTASSDSHHLDFTSVSILLLLNRQISFQYFQTHAFFVNAVGRRVGSGGCGQ
jgi:hypothetical protein